jgi:hypothetical protein
VSGKQGQVLMRFRANAIPRPDGTWSLQCFVSLEGVDGDIVIEPNGGPWPTRAAALEQAHETRRDVQRELVAVMKDEGLATTSVRYMNAKTKPGRA